MLPALPQHLLVSCPRIVTPNATASRACTRAGRAASAASEWTPGGTRSVGPTRRSSVRRSGTLEPPCHEAVPQPGDVGLDPGPHDLALRVEAHPLRREETILAER